MANGAAAIALVQIHRALADRIPWSEANADVQRMVISPVDGGAHTGLYYGAPAVAFLLHLAGADGHPRYAQALTTLDQHVTRIVSHRLAAAHARLAAGQHAQFREYDLFYGLVGLAALLLSRQPHSDLYDDLLSRVLAYLVRLTQPRRHEGLQVPGWWVEHDPDPILPTPGGHANFGMAHGAAGILAMLALAARHGHTVHGQREAIERLIDWFDAWQQPSARGPWWPQWITRSALRTGRLEQGPGRPSWCYGHVGIARALQLAAIATGDTRRQRAAEHALAAAVVEPNLDLITTPGLCHGMAGVYQTASRAAADSITPVVRQQLPSLAAALTRSVSHNRPSRGWPSDAEAGLLTGHAGVELVMAPLKHTTPLDSGWDRCLLIN